MWVFFKKVSLVCGNGGGRAVSSVSVHANAALVQRSARDALALGAGAETFAEATYKDKKGEGREGVARVGKEITLASRAVQLKIGAAARVFRRGARGTVGSVAARVSAAR